MMDPGVSDRGGGGWTSLGRVLSVTFTLLPAVDVADGRAVRLVQGEAGTETTYGAPRDAALAWQAGGAEWIHLVDLDAAFGRGSNADLLAAVIGELDVKVELSGGIRDDTSLDWALSTGCGGSTSARPHWRTAHGARGQSPRTASGSRSAWTCASSSIRMARCSTGSPPAA